MAWREYVCMWCVCASTGYANSCLLLYTHTLLYTAARQRRPSCKARLERHKALLFVEPDKHFGKCEHMCERGRASEYACVHMCQCVKKRMCVYSDRLLAAVAEIRRQTFSYLCLLFPHERPFCNSYLHSPSLPSSLSLFLPPLLTHTPTLTPLCPSHTHTYTEALVPCWYMPNRENEKKNDPLNNMTY